MLTSNYLKGNNFLIEPSCVICVLCHRGPGITVCLTSESCSFYFDHYRPFDDVYFTMVLVK